MSGTITSLSMKDGEAVAAYFARPIGEGPWPALVILGKIYNANHRVRAVADGYADKVFLCLTPDLY